MGPWMDFLLLAMALVAGWLGLVTLVLAGWRPLARPARPMARTVANPQAVDSDR